VLQKRLLPGKPADEKLKRRLAALLERRGFATHTIYTVLSEI
jgi:SOS response regulatory protein OraA/RecX